MIVFDLHCGQCSHRFEAWFASSLAYEAQQAQGLLACPMCMGSDISKAPMAPRLKGVGREEAPLAPVGEDTPAPLAEPSAPPSLAPQDAAKLQMIMAKAAAAQAEMLKESTWVGNKFAEQARAIHYGEAPTEAIHGEVDRTEAKNLHAEGVAVAPLLFPVVPPKQQN